MTSTASAWYQLDGNLWVFEDHVRACTLCGIDCGTCGNVWGTVGCSYPTVSCDDLPAGLRTDDGPIAPERYKAHHAAITRKLGARPIMPGTDFGPLVAPLRREPPHYFVDGFFLILREEVARDSAIERLGLRMARFVSNTARGNKRFVLHEVEAWPVAKRPDRIVRERMRGAAPPCSVCGFVRTPSYEGEPILASSVANVHIARLDQAPGTIFISAALKEALGRHRTTPSIRYLPVDVVRD